MGDEVEKTIESYHKQLEKYVTLLEHSTIKVTATIMKLLRHYNGSTKYIMDKLLEEVSSKLDNNCKYLNNTKKHIKERLEELQ